MAEPVFDIFSGKPEKDPLWLETVEGFAQARERMDLIAAQRPGRYFLFSTQAQAVLAETETFAKPEPSHKVHRAG